MESISGKKIFVLYPDENLRNIFYGSIRNTFAVYYMYDYEKVKPLAEYYPGCILVLNLINNDLHWLLEELNGELAGLDAEQQPSIIALYDDVKPLHTHCSRAIQYQGDKADLKAELMTAFTDFGGKGRRNFVRYGGNAENIASVVLKTPAGNLSGTVHDISASGLSLSLKTEAAILIGEKLDIVLSLGDSELQLSAKKILERNFDINIVHVLTFSTKMDAEAGTQLLGFIYSSLDSKMNEFIKKLSN